MKSIENKIIYIWMSGFENFGNYLLKILGILYIRAVRVDKDVLRKTYRKTN